MTLSIRFAFNRLLYQIIGSVMITVLASSYMTLPDLQVNQHLDAKAALSISKQTRA